MEDGRLQELSKPESKGKKKYRLQNYPDATDHASDATFVSDNANISSLIWQFWDHPMFPVHPNAL